MNVLDLIEQWSSAGALLITALLTLVQIAPVKINPWQSIARVLGKALNADMQESLDRHNATTARYRILRFDDEIRHDIQHTYEHFNQIIDEIDTYEKYCDTHKDYKNNKAVMAIENIKKTYEKCKEHNSFL